MRTPAFWYRPAGPLARLLSPLGAAYGAGGALRQRRARPRRAPSPVVCVGNLVAGGAGKTPVAIALALALDARGWQPAFLTRGHGGSRRGPYWVDAMRDSASEVGDEPLLLARHARCLLSRDRAAGAAALAGSGIIVMDDGHQNPSLVKDLSLVVVDGAVGFGNGFLIPAGPLRETVERGLARADALVILGDDRTGAARRAPGIPVLHADLRPGDDAVDLLGRRVLAFAGIGRPEKFFDTVRAVGAEIVAALPFADHHAYTEAEIRRIAADAEAAGAVPLTTEKDAVRLPPALRPNVRVLPVRCVWRDPAALDTLLDRLSPAKVR
jgi:tetraacyldisaccharide 4'-kinase